MKISEEIAKEYFTLFAIMDYGFNPLPNGDLSITIKDLQKFFKAINNKIEQLESDNQ